MRPFLYRFCFLVNWAGFMNLCPHIVIVFTALDIIAGINNRVCENWDTNLKNEPYPNEFLEYINALSILFGK